MDNSQPRMHLDNLKHLRESMYDHGKKSCRFDFRYGNTAFDVLFFADTNLALGFGKRGADPVYFEIPVEDGYRINTYTGDTYNLIRKALGINPYGKNGKFRTGPFFKAFKEAIPTKYAPRNACRSKDIARYKRDVEENEKVFFMGWRHNSEGHPSAENLRKTLEYMGPTCYRRAIENNLSSRWTDVEEWAIDFCYGDDVPDFM